ncbi:hypothetical protein ASPWEDRAFT_37129 [Aspergillus wentii DTO 134E9]|uniref:Zn(2)-C6 fungal-type domain-containing protein n=1 Tax=Aspergillus wentii DTO 134E9 TaxID=1073089 RepID=A0A1L9RWQ5_ASPWE|nr:uncharacterized protein ASPWEDRAFT_37129 [Aspergillus wentii DTO 134E9]KAI9928958.1 hypothetical protein MW887_001351 [Aspergillus wentii]OJJ39355.1 hypothetical protein ASPWEDRAFT_37129 [Aspergillus wentii DTO 134E9]
MPLTSSQPAVSERPRRKRNVVSRGRTGCLTCRRRRLKCDETKPGCNNCRRVNLPCEGYAQRITFKDQTNFIVERAQGKPPKRKGQTESTLIKDETDEPDHSFNTISDSCQHSSPVLKRLPTPTSQSPEFHIVQTTPLDFRREDFDGACPGTSNTTVASDSISKKRELRTPIRFSGRNLSPASDRDTFSSLEKSSTIDRGYMTPCSPESMDIKLSPSRVVPNSFLALTGAFEFPEDYRYYEYSVGGSFSSLSRILPLSELFKADPVSPHVHNAALALSALTLSSFEPHARGSVPLRRHAFHHSLKAVQGLQNELSRTTQSQTMSESLSTDAALSLFTTTMLLANFELQRGCLLSWRSHMHGAAICLNSGFKTIVKTSAGMLLIRAFARMALLLRLYNEEYSVTTQDTMSPKLADWLNLLLKQSSNLHDRILLMVEEITRLEIQKRQYPSQDEFWSQQSAELLVRLEEWRQDLPDSEVPVEDNSIEAYLTISAPNQESLVRVPALSFPNSADPCAAAVNYATYICTGMRARTRYLPDEGRVLPPGVEQTALTICRIAAGIPPARFGESFTYSHGMLPPVVGAYRWSTNPGLRIWVKHWLAGYKGTREGIWNISQTLKLLATMDRQFSNEGLSSGRGFVAVRMVDELTDPSADLVETDGKKPFKIRLYSRDQQEGLSKKLVDVE